VSYYVTIAPFQASYGLRATLGFKALAYGETIEFLPLMNELAFFIEYCYIGDPELTE
tara:strand:+ start:1163 stop:1333 length:171 start_codon:yes stop_codon:yes gene_type:complete